MSSLRTRRAKPARDISPLRPAWILTALLVIGSAFEMWRHRDLLMAHPEIALLDVAFLCLLW